MVCVYEQLYMKCVYACHICARLYVHIRVCTAAALVIGLEDAGCVHVVASVVACCLVSVVNDLPASFHQHQHQTEQQQHSRPCHPYLASDLFLWEEDPSPRTSLPCFPPFSPQPPIHTHPSNSPALQLPSSCSPAGPMGDSWPATRPSKALHPSTLNPQPLPPPPPSHHPHHSLRSPNSPASQQLPSTFSPAWNQLQLPAPLKTPTPAPAEVQQPPCSPRLLACCATS